MKFSLKIKMILIIVCIATGISVLAIVIYDKGIHDVIETQYEDRSVDIARLVAEKILDCWQETEMLFLFNWFVAHFSS